MAGPSRIDRWIESHFHSERSRNFVQGALALLILAPFLGLMIGGCIWLISSECKHLEITWKRSGEYVSQRAINSTATTDLWLDEHTGSILVVGSAEAKAQRAYHKVADYAQRLAPLTEADRKRVEHQAAKLLASSGCD